MGTSCVLSGVDTVLCGMLQSWTQTLSAIHPPQQNSLECLRAWQLGSRKTSLGLHVLRKLLHPGAKVSLTEPNFMIKLRLNEEGDDLPEEK